MNKNNISYKRETLKSENITSSVSGKNDGTVKLKELELMELFEQTLDPQKSGLIPASELKHILISIGNVLKPDEVYVIDSFKNADGMVKYEDLLHEILHN